MTKRLFLFMGVLIGFLLGELLRRQKMERLAVLEAKEARRKAEYAQYEKEWQEELAVMPFDERMEYELWEARMRAYDWNPPEDFFEEDDDAFET